MGQFCPNCGAEITKDNVKFCEKCGTALNPNAEPKTGSIPQQSTPVRNKIPVEAESIKDLNNIVGIIALIFGIIFLISGLLTLIVLVGIPLIIFAIINFIIRGAMKNINDLIDQGRYKEAKDKELIWVILGFLLGGIIIGVIILIAFLKYDALLRQV